MTNSCEINPACHRVDTYVIAGQTYKVYQCGASDRIELYLDEDNSYVPPSPEQDPLSFGRES